MMLLYICLSCLFQELFLLAKEMLSGEFLAFYDKIASEAFKSGIIKNFPYKSLSEMLNLVFTSMIRELVVNCQIRKLVTLLSITSCNGLIKIRQMI